MTSWPCRDPINKTRHNEQTYGAPFVKKSYRTDLAQKHAKSGR